MLTQVRIGDRFVVSCDGVTIRTGQIAKAAPAERREDDPATGSPNPPALEEHLRETRPIERGCLLAVAVLAACWAGAAMLIALMNG